jgi:hypothetical protein
MLVYGLSYIQDIDKAIFRPATLAKDIASL